MCHVDTNPPYSFQLPRVVLNIYDILWGEEVGEQRLFTRHCFPPPPAIQCIVDSVYTVKCTIIVLLHLPLSLKISVYSLDYERMRVSHTLSFMQNITESNAISNFCFILFLVEY